MCGIFGALSSTKHVLPSGELQRRLDSRGPDSTCTLELKHETSVGDEYVTLCSTVLSLRGSTTVTQPYQDAHGNYILCWNGEAWSIDGKSATGNDTETIHGLLVDAITAGAHEAQLSPETGAVRVAHALSRVAGPYAFAFFDRPHGQIYLGRDFLGRRSLLTMATETGDLIVSSVSDPSNAKEWQELDADGIYGISLGEAAVNLQTPGLESRILGNYIATIAPYNSAMDTDDLVDVTRSVIPALSLNKSLRTSAEPLDHNSASISRLEALLRDSLCPRVLNIPEPPMACNGIYMGMKRSKLAILFSGGLDCTVLARISHDLLPLEEPMDLINVAFENPRIHKDGGSSGRTLLSAYELCPDRITGRASYSELLDTCPGRDWRFVAVNIPYAETVEHKQQIITLMHPHNTEMDLSISLALYFAARGRGQLTRSIAGESTPYNTSARVMLSGLGADELFGGYTRHATAFRRGGIPALLDELELDVSRLGRRNLGRDDRVMSHWGREVRFPYLDEKLLSWALDAPMTEKCGFGESVADGLSTIPDVQETAALEPGKKVLRCLAWKLGMKGVAREKKRAIQFGARTAKMENRKTKGTQLLS